LNLNHTDIKTTRWTIVVLCLWTAVLVVLLTIPLAENPVPHTGVFRHWDKIAHVFLFGVTGFVNIFGARFFHRFGPRLSFGLAFSLFLAFGTEFAQSFLSYRTADVFDLLANLLGIFLGILLYVLCYQHRGLRAHLRL
jgi:VanZ family protein